MVSRQGLERETTRRHTLKNASCVADTHHGSMVIKINIKCMWEGTVCVFAHTHTHGRLPSNC